MFKPSPRLAAIAVLSALSALSSADAGQAFRSTFTSSASSDHWSSGFSVMFRVNKEKCQATYKNAWPQECASRAFGEPGAIAEHITLTPAVKGVWRWTDGSSLRFYPQTHLQPGTRYTVDIAPGLLPASVTTNVTRFAYITQPQAVSLGDARFWTDPSEKAAHGISVPISFIWPVNPRDIESRISLEAAGKNSGLTFGALKFSWNESKDRVVVSAPVLSMPATTARATLTVKGLPSFSYNKGARVVATNVPDTKQTITVKGNDRLMAIESINIGRQDDADLNSRVVVRVRSSLYVKPSELLNQLDIIELPLKASESAGRPTNWQKMPALGSSDINSGRKLTGKILSADAPTGTVEIEIPAQAGRYVMVAVKDTLRSMSGLKLWKVHRSIVQVPHVGADVGFLQPGNVLPVQSGGKVAVFAKGADTVNWKIGKVRKPFLALLAQSHGFMGSFDEETDFDKLSQVREGSHKLGSAEPGKAELGTIDLSEGGKLESGLYRVELQAMRKDEQITSSSRLILVSDTGLITKKEADGALNVFANDLSKGDPLSGAKITLLGKNGLPLASLTTDAQGLVRFGAEARKAVAVVSESGGAGEAWMSLSDHSRELDMSGFKTSGRHMTEQSISASVFAERGMFRPGEDVNFGFVTRSADWNALPENMPLEATVTAPSGQIVLKKLTTVGKTGLQELVWKTREDTPTGVYTLDLRVPQASKKDWNPVIGSLSVRVEEFEPEALSMRLAIASQPKGWIDTSSVSAQNVKLTLKTLYGTAAANHRIATQFNAQPVQFAFPQFPGVTFFTPTEPASSTEFSMRDVYAAADGTASVALPLAGLRGTVRGTLTAEGFEAEGGRGVSRSISAIFSPTPVAVGWKSAANLGFVGKNDAASLNLIAVTNNLEKTALQDLTVTLSKLRYVSALVRDSRGEYRYDTVPAEDAIKTEKQSIGVDGLNIPLQTTEAGDFMVSVTSADGRLLAQIPYSVAGNSMASGAANDLPVSDLKMLLSAENYEPGQEVEIRLVAPYAGSGLISIERDKVVASQWFKAPAGECVQKIRIPDNFTGRGYINVSFTRASDSPAVYLKPHSYAAAPFLSAMKSRDMGLAISAPEKVLPGQNVKLKISSKTDGKAMIFAVDEGILALTAHKTPSPLKDLLADRALDVTTAQILDLLMPNANRLRGNLPAFGGGAGMEAEGLAAGANPFRRRAEPPFARTLGIVDVSAAGKDLEFATPEYLSGKLRLIAVGSSDDGKTLRAGSAQANVTLKGGAAIQMLLPSAATPGDVIDGAVSITNSAEAPEAVNYNIAINLSSGLELAEPAPQQLALKGGEERVVNLKLRVKDVLGEQSITANATAASGTSVSRTRTVSIRPAASKARTETVMALKDKVEINARRDLYTFDADRTVIAAPSAIIGFKAAAEKLAEYPFGCTEQSISRAFPYAASLKNPTLRKIVLRSFSSDPAKQEELAEAAIARAIAAIRASSSYSGVSIWPGQSSHDFITGLAVDFLLTLRENGRAVADDLINPLLWRMEQIAGQDPGSNLRARMLAYANWLCLRDGRIMTQQLEKLETWFKNNTDAKELPHEMGMALIADSYRMLRLERRGRRIMPASFHNWNYNILDPLSPNASEALMCAVRTAMPWDDRSPEAVSRMMDIVLNEHSTTIEQAFGARALATLASVTPAGGAIKLGCATNPQDAQETEEGVAIKLSDPACRKFTVSVGANEVDAAWSVLLKEEGYDRGAPAAYSNGIEISRRFLNSLGEVVTKAKAGDVLTVEVKISSPRDLSNVAVVDLLPGGLEPLLNDAKGNHSAAERFERYEDRVVFFMKTNSQAKTITYRVRAVTAGNYTLPGTQATAMYTPSIGARTAAGAFAITR